MSKLDQLANIEGYGDYMDMLEDYHMESLVPCICVNPDCDYTEHLEPDCREGHCTFCNTQTLHSCMDLAGII